jgi:pilus assembly protein CpaB
MAVRRKLIGVALALVLALGGTYLVLGGRQQQGPSVKRQQVPMLVTTRALTAGTRVDSLIETPGVVSVMMVDVEQKHVDSLAAAADLQPYKGMVLANDVAAQSPLLISSFIDRGDLSLAAGGVEVPADLLQVSFSLEPQRVLGGALRAGDRVAVIASLTVTSPTPGAAAGAASASATATKQTRIVLQKALVSNVQLSNLANVKDSVTSEEGAPAVVGNYTVTLALSAADTERLTFALENGTLWLAKQPASASGTDSRIWTVDDVLRDPVTDYAPKARS